jgi:hypothetical protein
MLSPKRVPAVRPARTAKVTPIERHKKNHIATPHRTPNKLPLNRAKEEKLMK